jgi:plasmid stabilization system protein ParE
MMEFIVEFSPTADSCLEEQRDYYNNLVPGLGDRFVKRVIDHANALVKFPKMRIRYESVRCIPLSDFPFMIHFSVLEDRNLVRIHEVIHTSRNPSDSWNKNDWMVSEPFPAYGAHAYDLEYYYAA